MSPRGTPPHSLVPALSAALLFAGGPALAAPGVLHALDPSPEVLGAGTVESYELGVQIEKLADTEQMELIFPDGVYVAVPESIDVREDGAFWKGRIHDTWDVLLTERAGILSGLIYTPWVVYEVTSGPKGQPRLVHVDQEIFPGCAETDAPVKDEAHDPLDLAMGPVSGPAAAAVPGSAADPTVMDVMVVYTAQARSGAGGTSQMLSTIQAAIDITNTAYINSQVDARLNLVHAQEVSYNDSGSSSTDLNFVYSDTTVRNLRDQYGADLVALIVNANDACGRGYVQRNPGASFAQYAVQVTTRSCAVGNLSFAHEFGHNQGLEHDPANGTSPSSASYPYAFGHFHSGAYRTVMSYSNQCSGGCSRAPYFSNPNVNYQGLPTGIANSRENYRVINNTKAIVAAFRPTAGPAFTVGRVTGSQTSATSWRSQSTANSPAGGILVLGPSSFNGAHPGTMRARSVSNSSFQWQFDEWDYLDGGHTTESFDWLRVGTGAQTLGSLRAQAGSLRVGNAWVTVPLSQSFGATPVILPQVVSDAGSSAVAIRIRNVTTTSFQIRVQEEEANDDVHELETVHWLAIQPGSTTVDGHPVRVGRSADNHTHDWRAITYASTSAPRFFAHLQTTDGGDPAELRYRNLGSTSVEVMVEEEASGDSEINHTTERVGWMIIGG